MIMLKDNHINSRGSISEAVKAAKIAGFTTKIEVECSGERTTLPRETLYVFEIGSRERRGKTVIYL